MSVYAKFLDKNKSKLCESKSKKVSLKKLKKVNESDEIIDDLKALESDIIDYIHDKESVFEDVAEGTKYTVYEDALCINVKGRPNINVDIPDDMLETAGDYIDTYISDLADSLHKEDDDFVIYGRMGGYWGYKNFENYITINDKGLKVLKDKVIELMKDEDNTDFNSYEIVDYYKEDLADELDGRHLSISKDFLKKLEDLSSVIDTNEKIINDELKEMIENEGVNESCGKRKPKKPFPKKSLKESAKDRFVKKAASKSKLSESKKEWEEHLKETFDKFNGRLIDAYSYLGGAISIGEWINKNLSDYPQEIQDFMSEVDLNKLNEISNNMRPIVKGVTKTFYDTYKYKK